MRHFPPRPAPAAWVPSPLLLGRKETPRFLRAAWDEVKADSFGPWRVTERIDPALSLEQGPAPGLEEAPQAFEREPAPQGVAEGASDEAREARAPQRGEAAPGAPAAAGISPEELAAAEERAYERGLEAGRAEARAAMEADRARESEVLRALAIEMRALKEDPQRWFEPLRRLALHIAEQLVRGELRTSAEAITQVVRQCLSALDEPAAGVVVSLHPDDAQMLQAAAPPFLQEVKLQPDASLYRGSVRLRLDDTLLEDLIEHRLDAIAQPLLARPGPRAGESVLLRESFPAEPVEAAPLRRPRGLGDVVDATAVTLEEGRDGGVLPAMPPAPPPAGPAAAPDAWEPPQ